MQAEAGRSANRAESSHGGLFRTEVKAVGQARGMGRVLLQQPWSYGAIAVVATVLGLLVASYAYLGTYTRKATATGLLTPAHGMLRVLAPSAGLVTERLVAEGSHVVAEQPLFVLSGERQSDSGGAQALIAEQLDRRLVLAKRERTALVERRDAQLRMMERRLFAIDAEFEHLHQEHALLEQREQLSQSNLDRQDGLVAAGFVSAAQRQEAQAEVLAMRSQKRGADRSIAALQRERTELLAQREDIELRHRSELTTVDNTAATLRQEIAENAARARQIVTAPFDGTVTGLNVQVGQWVAASLPMVSLIPRDSPLVAHLYVSAGQAGFIAPGQSVRLRYAAYPYQKFGSARGSVQDIAQSPYAAQELPAHVGAALQAAALDNALFYRVTVGLEAQAVPAYGQDRMLKAGMLLEADVVQDTRRLYEWALEPLYAVTGKFVR